MLSDTGVKSSVSHSISSYYMVLKLDHFMGLAVLTTMIMKIIVF